MIYRCTVFVLPLCFASSIRAQAVEMPSFLALLSSEDISSGYSNGCDDRRNLSTKTYQDSKKVLRTLFLSLPVKSIYCQCSLKLDAGGLTVTGDCGFQGSEHSKNIPVNWEHAVPASRLGLSLPCWQGDGCESGRGRRCCRRADTCFNQMEADIHNLFASIGRLNYDRSNFVYGEIPGEERNYGSCDFEIDRANRIAEPPPEVRGDLARAYLYMSWRYGFDLTETEKTILLRWNIDDPPDAMERNLEAARKRLQGNGNPFISGWRNPTS